MTAMAKVTLEITDMPDGCAHIKFLFEPDLPADMNDWSAAQIQAAVLLEALEPDRVSDFHPIIDPSKMN